MAPPDTKAAPPGPSAESWAVKWVTTSVGAPAALYVAGYMIEHGQQDLFGVAITAAAPTTYLLATGRFFVDLVAAFSMQVRFIATWLGGMALVGAAIVVGVRWVFRSWRARCAACATWAGAHPGLVWGLGALLLTSAHIGVVACYVLPVIALRNLLYQVIDLRHSTELLRTIVCAREMLTGCAHPIIHYERLLHLRCLLHVALVSILVILGVCILRAPVFRSGPAAPAVRGVVVLLSIINILAVPFAYGKTLHRMPVKEVIVVYDYDGVRDSAHGLMLSESSDEVVFFDKDTRLIWQVPRRTIRVIRVEKIEDLLTVHARNSQESAALPAPR